jgi:hypothetical protein
MTFEPEEGNSRRAWTKQARQGSIPSRQDPARPPLFSSWHESPSGGDLSRAVKDLGTSQIQKVSSASARDQRVVKYRYREYLKITMLPFTFGCQVDTHIVNLSA